MGLGDLFKPKYKHSDWKVRLEAVKGLDDQEILIKIAKNDSDENVRLDAVKKINDKSVLADIAKNDSSHSVRLATFKKVDESVLADIAKNDETIYYLRRDAIEEIRNKSVLADIAKNCSDTDVCKLAVKNIDNESVLVDIAKNASEWTARLAAVRKISDESVLADIAKKDSFGMVRLEAVNKISDESVLVDIAKNASDESVRRDAVKKISDKKVLNDIFKTEKSSQVREIAYKATNKSKNISEYIKNSSNFYNESLKAFERVNYITHSIYDLGDYDVLIGFQKEQYNGGQVQTSYSMRDATVETSYLREYGSSSEAIEKVRYNGITWISENFSRKNQIEKRKYQYVKKISREDVQSRTTDEWLTKETIRLTFPGLRAIVITGITDKITDLSEMFYGCKADTISFANCDFSNVKNSRDIFYGCDNLKIIHADETSISSLMNNVPECIKYLDLKSVPQDVLKDIALNNESLDMRFSAIKMINDNDFLLEMTHNDSNDNIIMLATDNISEEPILEDIALNHENDKARVVATKKIDNQSFLEKISVSDSNEVIRINAKARLKELKNLDSNSVICPNCGKIIPKNAVRCKYCKKMLKEY